MRIVKPTNPPSMAVVVDTLAAGLVTLSLEPAHPAESRIDIVYIRSGDGPLSAVGVLLGGGAVADENVLVPMLFTGMRELARIRVNRAVVCIRETDIEETL